jgi:hypothetical protein
MFKRFCRSLLISLSVMFFVVSPALATYADPVSINITSAKVFRNVFATNDMLFIMAYDLAYVTIPTDPADETYYMNLYDVGGTLLYSRGVNYYQANLNSIYLTAAQAATLTWGTAYTLKLVVNPSKVATLTEGTNMVTVALDPNFGYIDGTLVTTPALLESYLSTVMHTISTTLLALTPPITILITTGLNDVLNTQGSLYFRQAIPGLDTVCPNLFQVSSTDIVNPSFTATGAITADQTIAGTLGTTTARGVSALASWFSITNNMAGGIVMAFIAVAFLVVIFRYSGSTTAAMILVIPILLIGVWGGLLPFALMATVTLLVAAYMLYAVWLRGV